VEVWRVHRHDHGARDKAFDADGFGHSENLPAELMQAGAYLKHSS
jgi:hypothetical protein